MATRTTPAATARKIARDARAPNAVFISYRRADSGHWAAKLSEHIGFRFGHDLVFRDVEDIRYGDDFLEVLARELRHCRVFLILIGRHWVVNAKGERRLDQPKDILRSEISHALRSEGTVIPVLVGGAAMPQATDLPRPLRPLVRRQAVVVRPNRWSTDVKALLEHLQSLIVPAAPQLPLDRAQTEVYDLQLDYFQVLDSDPAQALDLARKGHAYLDRALPLYPQDPTLKVTRGYLCKNEAMALVRLGRHQEAWLALDRGEVAFRTMLRERRRDEAAWNGLGSVELVRADLHRIEGRTADAKKTARAALDYIDKALSIRPDYAESRGDRQQAEAFLRSLR